MTHRPDRVPIGRKLALIQALLLGVVVLITGLSFWTLERVEGSGERVAERYAPQLDTISDVQMLMFRISLEARHAMLVTTDAERKATFERIGAFRQEMMGKLERFESRISTAEGRSLMEKIREADKDFWRLGGEVLAKVQAGDVPAAFAQLNSELVPARDRMVGHIAEQRRWQQKLVHDAVVQARKEAARTKAIVLAVALAGALLAGWLSWRLAVMLRGAFRRAQDVTRRIAGGELDSNIYVRQGDEFGSLFESIVDMQSRLHEVVANVRAAAGRIVGAAQSIEAANEELVRTTQAHAGSVQGTTVSTQQVTASVRESAEHVETASRLATDASGIAQRGGEVVSQVVHTMRGIDDASRRIGDIVNVIDGIAFQTNILALNAAVEAARAGDQGRGFAVVAGEVRSLAQRSAAAAKEVKVLIGDSADRVASGSEMVDQAGQTMSRIVESVNQVSGLMQDIARATREQREGVERVHGAVDEIGQATVQSAEAVRRSAEAAAALREQARALEDAVAAFNVREFV